jgi:hypothetical protein
MKLFSMGFIMSFKMKLFSMGFITSQSVVFSRVVLSLSSALQLMALVNKHLVYLILL